MVEIILPTLVVLSRKDIKPTLVKDGFNTFQRCVSYQPKTGIKTLAQWTFEFFPTRLSKNSLNLTIKFAIKRKDSIQGSFYFKTSVLTIIL